MQGVRAITLFAALLIWAPITHAGDPPAAPAQVSAYGVEGVSQVVELTWTPVLDAVTYNVYGVGPSGPVLLANVPTVSMPVVGEYTGYGVSAVGVDGAESTITYTLPDPCVKIATNPPDVEFNCLPIEP